MPINPNSDIGLERIKNYRSDFMLPNELSKLRTALRNKKERTNEDNELLKELDGIDQITSKENLEKMAEYQRFSLSTSSGRCPTCGKPI
jgi:hypothetical protein